MCVSGPEESLSKFLDGLKDETGLKSVFETYVPMPDVLRKVTSPGNTWEDTNKALTDAETQEHLQKYGAVNWYDWASKNWGTKWADYETELSDRSEGHVEITYETAWGPAEQGVLKLSEVFPDLTFRVDYDEPGMSFVGHHVAQNGEMLDESRRNLDEDEARQQWPEMYEDEEDDEVIDVEFELEPEFKD